MKNSSSGTDFPAFLTILFIGLKLTGFITWSWWWVLSPIWISIIVAGIFFTIFFAILAKLANHDIEHYFRECSSWSNLLLGLFFRKNDNLTEKEKVNCSE